MKFYVASSNDIDILKEEWLLPSLKDEFDVRIKQLPQAGSATYGEEPFAIMLRLRAEFVLNVIKENLGGIFLYGEVDMQFFQPVENILLDCLNENDVIFQNNSLPRKSINTGFWICRASEKMRVLWECALKFLDRGLMYDQDAVNLMLGVCKQRELPDFISSDEAAVLKDLKWDYLPNTFFVPQHGFTPPSFLRRMTNKLRVTQAWGQEWVPGRPLIVPQDIVLHHANWTRGTANKIAQLQYVRAVVERQGRA